jgi:hypothetical protein
MLISSKKRSCRRDTFLIQAEERRRTAEQVASRRAKKGGFVSLENGTSSSLTLPLKLNSGVRLRDPTH